MNFEFCYNLNSLKDFKKPKKYLVMWNMETVITFYCCNSVLSSTIKKKFNVIVSKIDTISLIETGFCFTYF